MKLLTIHGQHHPQADINHLYVPRKQGGRGQIQLEEAYRVEITKLVEYVDRIYMYHEQKKTANADYVNNTKRQHITMYQHAQYVLAQNNTYTDMIQCVLPYARKSG